MPDHSVPPDNPYPTYRLSTSVLARPTRAARLPCPSRTASTIPLASIPINPFDGPCRASPCRATAHAAPCLPCSMSPSSPYRTMPTTRAKPCHARATNRTTPRLPLRQPRPPPFRAMPTNPSAPFPTSPGIAPRAKRELRQPIPSPTLPTRPASPHRAPPRRQAHPTRACPLDAPCHFSPRPKTPRACLRRAQPHRHSTLRLPCPGPASRPTVPSQTRSFHPDVPCRTGPDRAVPTSPAGPHPPTDPTVALRAMPCDTPRPSGTRQPKGNAIHLPGGLPGATPGAGAERTT
jgi:hypothetical protein